MTNTSERIAALLYGNGRAQMTHQETVINPNEDIVMIPVIGTNEDIVTLPYENGRVQRPQPLAVASVPFHSHTAAYLHSYWLRAMLR